MAGCLLIYGVMFRGLSRKENDESRIAREASNQIIKAWDILARCYPAGRSYSTDSVGGLGVI